MLIRGTDSSIGHIQIRAFSKQLFLISIVGFLFLFIPAQSFASSSIAAAVAAACAPEPTVPDVGSCSSCHSTTNNRGPNDLTTAGTWALSTSTYMNFCPAATTPPPTPTPTPTPPPTSPPPGSPATPTPSPTPAMGGSGASDDDDDEGEGESDDDDDGASAAGSSSFSSRLSSLRARLRSIFLGR